MSPRLRCRRHFFGLLAHFLDSAYHVERLLGKIVVFSFDDFLEAAHCVFDFYVLPCKTRELLGYEHWLRQELLDFSSARYGLLVIVRQFFDSQNRDDVLQFLVPLKDRLHRSGYCVVFLSYCARIQNAREAGQRIDRGIDAAFDDLPAQVRGGVEVSECRRRGGIGVVVSWDVNRLYGRDRTVLRRGDSLLQLADFRVEVGLITYRGRHAAEQRRYFRARLNEAENIVDEEEHVEVFFIAEIFGDCQAGQADAEPGAGWLRHLSVDQRATRLLRIAGDHDA